MNAVSAYSIPQLWNKNGEPSYHTGPCQGLNQGLDSIDVWFTLPQYQIKIGFKISEEIPNLRKTKSA